MKKTVSILLTVLVFGLLLSEMSCKKDEFTNSSSAKLDFSTDTVLFDTVFTTVGSATEVFTIFNRNDQPVKVSSIRIAGGTSSLFRINVDGISGSSFTDIEIGANDSIFVFSEVTVDPNNQNTPLVVSDSILFETNGNLQKVNLVAWGQDAYFHRATDGGSAFFVCNENWNNDKPHVIYGLALVDSGCILNINAGANVHLHPGSSLIVLSSGTLRVNGTIAQPVNIQGDRLGIDYANVPGQWGKIWLSNYTHSNLVNGTKEIGPGSRNCVIQNAVIKNGTIGIQADTVYAPGDITLRMENTIVKNMSYNGIACLGANVKAFNCVYANCGAQTANLLIGGNYDFYHCTFANYWISGNRQDPAISLNNYYETNVRRIDAKFYNCIVHGNLDNELGVDSFPRAAPNQCNFLFDHSLLKLESSYAVSNSSFFNSIIKATGYNNRPGFKDITNNDFQLDSLSVAIDAGDLNILSVDPVLNNDLKGISRPQGPAPDLGAYEKQ